jgi:hypothetical protein
MFSIRRRLKSGGSCQREVSRKKVGGGGRCEGTDLLQHNGERPAMQSLSPILSSAMLCCARQIGTLYCTSAHRRGRSGSTLAHQQPATSSARNLQLAPSKPSTSSSRKRPLAHLRPDGPDPGRKKQSWTSFGGPRLASQNFQYTGAGQAQFHALLLALWTTPRPPECACPPGGLGRGEGRFSSRRPATGQLRWPRWGPRKVVLRWCGAGWLGWQNA